MHNFQTAFFNSSDTNYFAIKSKIKTYIDSLPIDTGGYSFIISGTSGIKEDGLNANFGRMQYRFESRVDASGNMNVANNMMQSYKLNSLACNVTNHQNTSSDYKWKCLGPAYSNYSAGIEADDSIQNQGRIIAISQNPNNIDDILCSCVSGGIWKTDNGGATWRNITDDDGFSYIGYSSIKRSSINSNWKFASSLCGNPGPYALLAFTNLPYSGGIIMSTDNGETWIEIQSVNDIPNSYILEQQALVDYNDLLNFTTWKIEALSNVGSIQHLDSSRLEALQSIANNGGRLAKERAQSILNYFYDGTYQSEPEFPTSNNQRRARPYISAAKPLELAYIRAYPNPSKDFIHFEYLLPCIETEAILEIRDISGKLILQKSISKDMRLYTLATDTYSSGVYLYKMLCGGNIIGKGQFSVVK